jgi:hypothetical protein
MNAYNTYVSEDEVGALVEERKFSENLRKLPTTNTP